ncbi:hypothetical protein P8452_56910 [Trifolium repens]|nr:hypothetical protein P8452_56910 [Trifolium repens]
MTRYSFIDTWVMHLVGSDDRNEIWKGLKELWDIPKNDAVEKKTMVYAETWKAFVKSREEPSFLEKRKRGQKAQSYNKYPHRLSHGGYALLEKNMMADRLKERQQAAGGSEVPPPSPPPRHEKWMKARTKPSGDYTSEDTRLVAEKIDSLVSEGTFVPQGRHDILTEATGRVPVPTCEVATVGEAPNNFIQWPKRLLKLTSKKKYDAQPIKSEPICQKLVVKAINMDQTLKLNGEFGGTVWLIYLHRYCMELGNNNVYGFIDPHFIHGQNERGSVQSYIQKKLCDDKKICYLAPYFNNHHWQLLIINPTKLEVVFLCSLGKRPDKKIYEILDTALTTYNKLQRARKQKKVNWLFPTSQKQKASYECGYFIMIHMLNIVSATLVGSWTQKFGDSKPFQKDEVKNVQERYGNIILEHIEASTDNDMN